MFDHEHTLRFNGENQDEKWDLKQNTSHEFRNLGHLF